MLVIDSSTVGKDMDVCALGTKFAVTLSPLACGLNICGIICGEPYLCKVFADIVVCISKVVTEWTSGSSLACALPEELAWYVGCICQLSVCRLSSRRYDFERTLPSRRAPWTLKSSHTCRRRWRSTVSVQCVWWRNIQRTRTHMPVFSRHSRTT